MVRKRDLDAEIAFLTKQTDVVPSQYVKSTTAPLVTTSKVEKKTTKRVKKTEKTSDNPFSSQDAEDFELFALKNSLPHPHQCSEYNEDSSKCKNRGTFIDVETGTVTCGQHPGGSINKWLVEQRIFPKDPVRPTILWQHFDYRIVFHADWSPRWWNDKDGNEKKIIEPIFCFITLEEFVGKDVLGVEKWDEIVSGNIVGLLGPIPTEKRPFLVFSRAIIINYFTQANS